jgi:hypothetical protein
MSDSVSGQRVSLEAGSHERPIQADIHDGFHSDDYGQAANKDDATSVATPLAPTERNFSNIFATGKHSPSLLQRCLHLAATLWQEILAIVLLLSATFASLATLYPYQDRPLPEWPFGITIGALLSIYSVVLRLAASFLITQGLAQMKWRWFYRQVRPLHDLVIHDNATRGPLGVFGLLWRLPFPITWQWLGCVLAILALLVGPFTQQVVQYTQCSLPADALDTNATIARTAVFWLQDQFLANSYRTPLDSSAQAAINNGIYTPGVTENKCSSGNCTYEPYSSVGYCARCEDISSQVHFSNISRLNTGRTGPSGGRSSSTSTIPGGIGIQFEQYLASVAGDPFQGTLEGDRANISVCDSLTSEGTQILIGLPVQESDAPPEGCEGPSATKNWRCQRFGAANCVLSPCVRTYHAETTNNIFHERVTSEEMLPSTGLGPWPGHREYSFGGANLPMTGSGGGTFPMMGSLNQSCISSDQWGVLRSLNYTTTNTSATLLPYSVSVAREDGGTHLTPLDQDLVDRGCFFGIDTNLIIQLQTFMSSICGTLTATPSIYAPVNNFQGPQILQSIYNYGDFSLERTQDLFNNISTSLTNYMRANPGPKGGFNGTEALTLPALGIAYTTKTCVRVRWIWLAWPTLVSLSTLIFFVGVIASSSALPRNVRTWKSSPLPSLFYGSSATENTEPASQHVNDMEATAKKVYVGLDCGGSGCAVLRHRGGVVGEASPLPVSRDV